MPTDDGFYLVNQDNSCIVATGLEPESQLALGAIEFDPMKIWIYDESTRQYLLSGSTQGFVIDVVNGNVMVLNPPSQSPNQRWTHGKNRLWVQGMPNMVATRSQMGSFAVVTAYNPADPAQDFRPVRVGALSPAR